MSFDYESIEPGYYDQAYHLKKGIQSKWHNIKFDSIRQILNQINFKDMLDIACGPGTFIGTLQDEHKKFTGIDLSEKQIEYANAKYSAANKKFINQNATSMNFENESFDLITSIEFIEHIEIEVFKQILGECRRCLKKDGYLLLTTPNYEFGWYIIEYILSKVSRVNYSKQHITRFKLERLKEFLTANGFKISLARKYIYNAPFTSPFGWHLAQKIHELEFKNKNIGYSLVVVAQKI